MKKLRTSCIIPFWNEELFLFDVLEKITRVDNLTEIICVDDASENDNYLEIRKRFPGIKVVRLNVNMGKTDAIRKGLNTAIGDYILLLDADLQNLQYEEIELAIQAIEKNTHIDMLILRRVNADLMIKLYRADVLFTGERILRKTDLVEILKGPAKRWQLESVINTWMYLNQKNVLWMAHSGTNTDKALKWGWVNGLIYDMKTFGDMVFATGVNNFIKQILFYAKDELKAS